MSSIVEDIDKSASWVAFALSSSGYRADFSLQSLQEIDRFFDEQSQNGAANPGGLLAENLGSRLFAIGSYLGEVLRRHLGGEWIGNNDDPLVEINVELHLSNKKICWPMQRVMKRFKNGPDDGIAGYGLVLSSGPNSGQGPAQSPSINTTRKTGKKRSARLF